MLSWAILFFILALVAAFFGFGGIAGTAATIAKVLLALFDEPAHSQKHLKYQSDH